MIDRAKETAEFDASIAEIAKRLAKHRVAIVKKDYYAEAFGSWHLIAGDEKKKINFSYEGKESYLMYRDAAVTPKDYRDLQHKTFQTWKGEDPIAFVEEVLAREFPRP
jgi:meiotically up-regulated gene 157 (Mug157) protein